MSVDKKYKPGDKLLVEIPDQYDDLIKLKVVLNAYATENMLVVKDKNHRYYIIKPEHIVEKTQ